MSWGWNPDTVGALAAGVATVLATLAALLAVLDVRRRRAADQRSQANLIGSWTILEEDKQNVSGAPIYQVILHVANRSDLPVTRVIVRSMPARTLGESIEPVDHFWHSLGPGQTVQEDLGATDGHDALGYPGRVLEVQFTDHFGVNWIRDDSKGLRRA